MPPPVPRLRGWRRVAVGAALVLVPFAAGLAGARLVDGSAPATTQTRGTGAVPPERPSPPPAAPSTAPAVPTMADLIPPPRIVTAQAPITGGGGSGGGATPNPRPRTATPSTVDVPVLTFTPATATP